MAIKFFKDWLVQKSNTYLIDGVPKVLTRDFGTVYQEGDKDKADYFNEIQKNCVYSVNATRVVEGVVEIYDITLTGSDVFPLFNTQFLVNFNETNTKVDPILRWNGKTYAIRKNYRFDSKQFIIGELQKRNLVVLDQTNSIALVNEFNSNRNDVGVIKYVARNFLKANELKANGAAVLISAYQELANDIYCGDALNPTALFGYKCTNPSNPESTRSISGTHIVLPDLRGEFIRGWDDSRGVDSERALGSYQVDQIQRITGALPTTQNQGSGIFNSGGGSGALRAGGTERYAPANGNLEIKGTEIFFDSANSVRSGTETRPRNIALLAVINF